MRIPKGEIGQRPVQRVEKGPPTHAAFHPDGTTTIVYPSGHDQEMLVKLPRGYSDDTHEPHHASRSFVRRATPPPPREIGLDERVGLLEKELAALRAPQMKEPG